VAVRGRDVAGVIAQYQRFVKPAFDAYIGPSRRHADVIIPWQQRQRYCDEDENGGDGDGDGGGMGDGLGIPGPGTGASSFCPPPPPPAPGAHPRSSAAAAGGSRDDDPASFSPPPGRAPVSGGGSTRHAHANRQDGGGGEDDDGGGTGGGGGGMGRESSEEEGNAVAIDLIAEHIRSKLRQHPLRRLYPQLEVVPSNFQLRGLHTILRDRETEAGDFAFFADRVNRLIIEAGLGHLPFAEKTVVTPTGHRYVGVGFCRGICGVSVIRSGEAMEAALRECCQGIKIGKILVHR